MAHNGRWLRIRNDLRSREPWARVAAAGHMARLEAEARMGDPNLKSTRNAARRVAVLYSEGARIDSGLFSQLLERRRRNAAEREALERMVEKHFLL